MRWDLKLFYLSEENVQRLKKDSANFIFYETNWWSDMFFWFLVVFVFLWTWISSLLHLGTRKFEQFWGKHSDCFEMYDKILTYILTCFLLPLAVLKWWHLNRFTFDRLYLWPGTEDFFMRKKVPKYLGTFGKSFFFEIFRTFFKDFWWYV